MCFYTISIHTSTITYFLLLLTVLSVESLCELGDGWWYLEPLVEHSLLSLKTNILWPADESSQVSLRLNITTYIITSKIT